MEHILYILHAGGEIKIGEHYLILEGNRFRVKTQDKVLRPFVNIEAAFAFLKEISVQVEVPEVQDLQADNNQAVGFGVNTPQSIKQKKIEDGVMLANSVTAPTEMEKRTGFVRHRKTKLIYK